MDGQINSSNCLSIQLQSCDSKMILQRWLDLHKMKRQTLIVTTYSSSHFCLTGWVTLRFFLPLACLPLVYRQTDYFVFNQQYVYWQTDRQIVLFHANSACTSQECLNQLKSFYAYIVLCSNELGSEWLYQTMYLIPPSFCSIVLRLSVYYIYLSISF